jgi:hypothetical protein
MRLPPMQEVISNSSIAADLEFVASFLRRATSVPGMK